MVVTIACSVTARESEVMGSPIAAGLIDTEITKHEDWRVDDQSGCQGVGRHMLQWVKVVITVFPAARRAVVGHLRAPAVR